ncbi:MAG: VWA domain-containing protein [Candidatus Poribacteria bacterium]|nr:VWA domain-containing protein [Candidatus Poribacteria bacterium]
MTFEEPFAFLTLTAIPLLIYFHFKGARRGSLSFSSIGSIQAIQPSWTNRGREGLLFLRCVAILLIAFGLARPQKGVEESKLTGEGIDIVLVIDVSTSMRAQDFQISGQRYNRLHVVKEVVKEFIVGRSNDRIGIVVFAGRPYTLCPLTLDHGWLIKNLDRAQIGMLEDGTAIGTAIATGTNRLRESAADSKVIILLTDGRNNAGRISPETAANLAKTLGVKIYTIGAGTKGMAPFPTRGLFGKETYQPVQIEIDDESLTRIAQETGGRYFRATDTANLLQVYDEIDEMEKTEFETPQYLEYKEFYVYFLIPALICFLTEIGLANTRLRILP